MLKKVIVESKLQKNMAIEVQARNHKFIIDQPKAGGGDDLGPTPLEYFFSALAGCIGSIALIIAKQKRFDLRACNVKVEGELDIDVLMGKSCDARAGFQWMKAYVEIDADMTDQEKKDFLHEIDARCPISDNIQATTKVEFELVD